MKNKYTKRGAFQRQLTEWGDIVTADHMDTKRIKVQGFSGETDVFVIKDLFSGLLHGYPSPSHKHEWVQTWIRNFSGRRPVHLFYSDNAPEFIAAADRTGIAHEHSAPGQPRNNAIIERANQLLIGGVSTSLLEAGLPHCYWPWAMECWCVNWNTNDVPDQMSPWEMTHGKKFEGKRLPFGCLVYFKPSPNRDDTLKFGPKGHLGVFAGYFMAPGYKWSGNYLVWELKGFHQADLRADASKYHQRTPEPHVTQVVMLPEGDLQFPLKERYEKINRDTDDPDLGPDADDQLVTDEQRRKRAWNGPMPEEPVGDAAGQLGVTPGPPAVEPPEDTGSVMEPIPETTEPQPQGPPIAMVPRDPEDAKSPLGVTPGADGAESGEIGRAHV